MIAYNPEKSALCRAEVLSFWVSAPPISGLSCKALVLELWYLNPVRPEAQSLLVLRYPDLREEVVSENPCKLFHLW